MKIKDKLVEIFKSIPKANPSYNKDWISYTDLLKHLTSEDIKKFEKNKLLKSNHAEYDMAEPSFRLNF